MQDLTEGSIPRHVIKMAVPIAVGMLFQTLYLLIDLYFVAQLGGAAIAGVSAAGNIGFIVMALTQILGVGTVVLIAQAVGRNDQGDANLVFNQSLLMALLFATFTLLAGYLLTPLYMRGIGADAATEAAGISYLYWYMPGLALQFALVAMGSGLRGTGLVKPTMVVQMISVLLNAFLAPVLIAGWGTGYPMGVAGAGLASSISIAIGVLLLMVYFVRLEKYVRVEPQLLAAQPAVWKRILIIGTPAGGEFALLFVYMVVIYFIIRDFGAAAQAGFGVGSRVMQAIFLPVIAIAFATAPIAGQNVGAGLHDRVRETFRSAALIGGALMLLLTLICQSNPEWFVHGFTRDPQVVAVAAEFLTFISWNFIANGLIFTCSGMFQAMGNTLPALTSSGIRLLSFVIPGIWLSRQPGFELKHLWMLSIATITLQAVVSCTLLRREFKLRLRPAPTPVGSAESANRIE